MVCQLTRSLVGRYVLVLPSILCQTCVFQYGRHGDRVHSQEAANHARRSCAVTERGQADKQWQKSEQLIKNASPNSHEYVSSILSPSLHPTSQKAVARNGKYT